jgi:hypothetical protein
MKKTVYKVTCNFYVRAKDEDDAAQKIVDYEDINGFIDHHLIFTEVTKKIKDDELWLE